MKFVFSLGLTLITVIFFATCTSPPVTPGPNPPTTGGNKVAVELQLLVPTEGALGGESYYLAGSANQWNPMDKNYRFTLQEDGSLALSLWLELGEIMEYKITRGSWESVEKDHQGRELENRKLSTDDLGPSITVAMWADRLPPGLANQNTQQANPRGKVSTINDFPAPELGGIRRIWIYLPPDYQDTTEERYPVLYLHDGQNVFDPKTSFAGEWGVDETLETLFSQGLGRPTIVVAIDNGGGRRLQEYTPFAHPRHGGGGSKAYGDFLVKNLKPWVDQRYKTLPQREATGIAGSSLGGLVSLWAALAYPDTFGMVGAFSPSFWFSPGPMSTMIQNHDFATYPLRIYLDAGDLEDQGSMSRDARAFFTLLDSRNARGQTRLVIDPLGNHNEASWRRRFGDAFLWLFPPSP